MEWLITSILYNSDLDKYKDYLLHGPNYSLAKFKGPKIVTIHDLSVYRIPRFHPKMRVSLLRRQIKNSVKLSDLFITDSLAVKTELSEFFDVSPSRINVTPLAAADNFMPRDSTTTSEVLQKHELSHGGYVLYVGTIEPRKNLETLLKAYSQLPRDVRRIFPLVFAGAFGWNYREIQTEMLLASAEGWFKHLGYINDDDLAKLYSGSAIFVYPSIYEGFGLPILEAMASGVPVLCSSIPVFHEVAGDKAIFFDPYDVEQLHDRIYEALTQDAWRRDAISQGLLHSSSFTWCKTAEMTATAYQKAFERN